MSTHRAPESLSNHATILHTRRFDERDLPALVRMAKERLQIELGAFLRLDHLAIDEHGVMRVIWSPAGGMRKAGLAVIGGENA